MTSIRLRGGVADVDDREEWKLLRRPVCRNSRASAGDQKFRPAFAKIGGLAGQAAAILSTILTYFGTGTTQR